MKRAILTGAIAFLLGSSSSPQAAGRNEALDVLCMRFQAGRGDINLPKLLKVMKESPVAIERSIAASDAAVLNTLRVVACGVGPMTP